MLASDIINRNLYFFQADEPILFSNKFDVSAFRKVFDIFQKKIEEQQQLYMDFCIDISPQSLETVHEQLEKVQSKDPGRVALWGHVLQSVRDSCLIVNQQTLMIERLENHLRTLAERDELMAKHDRLRSERDELMAKHERLRSEWTTPDIQTGPSLRLRHARTPQG
jgi:Zn-dependent oligopeptidase